MKKYSKFFAIALLAITTMFASLTSCEKTEQLTKPTDNKVIELVDGKDDSSFHIRDTILAANTKALSWTNFYTAGPVNVATNANVKFYLTPVGNRQYKFVASQTGKSFGVDIFADLNGTLNLVKSYVSTNGTVEARFTTQDGKYGGRFVCVVYAGSTGLSVNVNMAWRDRAQSYSANMANYKHVYQFRVPSGWDNGASYTNLNSSCTYPDYVGTTPPTVQSTLICAVSAYMMARNLVNKPSFLDLSSDITTRSHQMIETVMRLKNVAGVAGNGSFSITNLHTLATGNASKKGDFTNWGSAIPCSGADLYTDCNNNGVYNLELENCKAELFHDTDQYLASNTILNALSHGQPVVAVLKSRNVGVGMANIVCEDYFKYLKNVNTSFGGHFVTIVGMDVTQDGYRHIYYVDPMKEGNQVWSAPQEVFLQAMRNGSSSAQHNLLIVKGL